MNIKYWVHLLFIFSIVLNQLAECLPVFIPAPTDDLNDVAALVDFFDATIGNKAWYDATNWLVNGTSVCDWFGITCDKSVAPFRVQQIDLSWNMLDDFGQHIPDSIGNLTALTTLVLSQNLLSSTVPSSIGKLVNLQTIDFEKNYLSGAFPDSIVNCSLLETLILSRNHFTKIPSSISNLRLLESIEFSWNAALIEPPLLSVCPPNLKYFRSLSIIFSNFRHTSEYNWLWTCQSLLEIEISGLQGPFPQNFGQFFPSLRSLRAMYNTFSGGLPSSICRLNQLKSLKIAFSNLSGHIPDCIGHLSQLIVLNLQSNDLNGTLPSSIGHLQRLMTVDLSSNQISGPLPWTLTNMSALTSFYINSNLFDGSLDVLSHLPQLEAFFGSANRFTGKLPTNMSQISDFEANSNQLSGTLPFEMFLPTNNLFRYDVSNNFLSGTIPNTIPDRLSMLLLSNNRLEGELPLLWCNYSESLAFFSVSQNLIHGTLPQCMGDIVFPRLSNFNISFNKLTGSIPTKFGLINNRSFTFLDLRGNMLSGTIPTSFMYLNLKYLDLSFNQLTGPFPTLLCSRHAIARIDLAGNLFSGSLSSMFDSGLYFPTYLNISHNRFSGLVTKLTGQCNASNAPACPSVAILDARGNHFDCPFPQYSQLDTLFLRDACSPPYTTFAIYSGSLACALLLLLLVRYFVLRQFGSASASLVTPSYAPSRWKWLWHGLVYILSLVTLGSDVYTMYTIGEYLLSRIDNCSLVNSYAVWKSLPVFTDWFVSQTPKYLGIPFSSFVQKYIVDSNFNAFGFMYKYLNPYDVLNVQYVQQATSQFSAACLAIQSGCALRPSIEYSTNYATECFMAFDDQAPFGGTSHRLFAYICIAIVAVRALVELGKASVVLWSWVQGRIVGARWSIDFVGASLLSPLFVLSVGGDWSEYFKVVVSHEASYWSLAWRVVHQSLLCSVPLLCANLYFLFAVSQSGLQLLNMFSVLSACVSIPLTIVRALLAWRSLDQSYSTSDVAHVLEFTQNVVDIGKVDIRL